MDHNNKSTSSPSDLVPHQPITRPEWATGDPFFDTMAGMDTPEYHQYHNQIRQLQSTTVNELVSTTASLSIEGSSDNSSSSHGQQPALSDATTGLEHWNRTRDQWTKGRWHVVPSANSQNPALSAIHPGNHDAIYDSLVYDRKRLSKPIPLPLVIKVLVSGWKRDGLWQESPAQPPSSAPNSAPSSAPSSTTGINAYVPGFSSTNSKPLQRK